MELNPFDILKNAQKLKEQMGVFQEKLGMITVTGSSGGGMVEIRINGRMELLAVRIAPEAADPRDVEMLQDLIVAAFADAMEKIRDAINREMGALAGGLGLAGIPGFPGAGFPGTV
ncbi:MAG: YbaB/EbfC family nucleoid-associated protein [Spirochaetaceae bacterium]|jgi:DNA-binding YbaB/EbfC family protein|nr:YbaB/EbfC family nucleoid-associated protein [Spirochaetaceae bacterium]